MRYGYSTISLKDWGSLFYSQAFSHTLVLQGYLYRKCTAAPRSRIKYFCEACGAILYHRLTFNRYNIELSTSSYHRLTFNTTTVKILIGPPLASYHRLTFSMKILNAPPLHTTVSHSTVKILTVPSTVKTLTVPSTVKILNVLPLHNTVCLTFSSFLPPFHIQQFKVLILRRWATNYYQLFNDAFTWSK